MTGPRVIAATFGPKPKASLAADLRALADQVDRGEVTELVAMYIDHTPPSEFCFVWAGDSIFNEIALSAMLHAQALGRARGG
jgi:hypothetical protein